MRFTLAAPRAEEKGISLEATTAATKIDTREELINALQEAIQIEHGLMIQYLFAALSCKRRTDEGLTEAELDLVSQWEQRILRVARDEMAHLATACNMISAIGGCPDFNRPNFPQREHRWFPFGFHLERLDADSLARFVRAESPKPVVLVEAIAPEPIVFDFVGELYGLIGDGFRNLTNDPNTQRFDPAREPRVFIGRPETQDTSSWTARLSVMPIRNRASAEAAIKFIVEQGEGTDQARAGSHFDIFSTIAKQFDDARAANPGFSASRNVLKNPLTRPHRDADIGFNLIEASTTAHQLAQLFNHVYASMLMLLMQFFDPADETPEQREVVRDTARRTMSGLLRPMAEMLTELPATSDPNGPTAGPPFELYGVLKIPAYPRARFAVIAERFAAASGETKNLMKLNEPKLARLAFLARNFELAIETLAAQSR